MECHLQKLKLSRLSANAKNNEACWKGKGSMSRTDAEITSLLCLSATSQTMAAYNSGLLGSKTFSTLSTAMGESRSEYCDTTLLLSDLHNKQTCMLLPQGAKGESGLLH